MEVIPELTYGERARVRAAIKRGVFRTVIAPKGREAGRRAIVPQIDQLLAEWDKLDFNAQNLLNFEMAQRTGASLDEASIGAAIRACRETFDYKRVDGISGLLEAAVVLREIYIARIEQPGRRTKPNMIEFIAAHALRFLPEVGEGTSTGTTTAENSWTLAKTRVENALKKVPDRRASSTRSMGKNSPSVPSPANGATKAQQKVVFRRFDPARK